MRDQSGLRGFLVLSVLAVLVVTAAPELAAQTSRGLRSDAGDRIARLLFAPELVMRHQAELGLTDGQKERLVVEMQQTQSDLVPLQLEMAEIGGELGKLLTRPVVDETEALAAAERVLALESQIKMRHLALVVRIKNLLTEEQQQTLRRIRSRQWEQRRDGGGR